MGNNPRVPLRKLLAVASLLVAPVVLPELAWAGMHLVHHDHDAGRARLALGLVHGHEHPEDTLDHQHHLLTAPSVRTQAPRDHCFPAAVARTEPGGGEILPRWSRVLDAWGARLSGPSPPRLHLLCTLLI